jgi:hypothetical protein
MMVDTFIQYENEDSLRFVLGDMVVPFERDALLVTFPEIPWDPESCTTTTRRKDGTN